MSFLSAEVLNSEQGPADGGSAVLRGTSINTRVKAQQSMISVSFLRGVRKFKAQPTAVLSAEAHNQCRV